MHILYVKIDGITCDNCRNKIKKAVLPKITYIYGNHVILRKSIHIVVSFRMNY